MHPTTTEIRSKHNLLKSSAILIILVVAWFFVRYPERLPGYHHFNYSASKYAALKTELVNDQQNLARRYRSAATSTEKKKILKKAGTQLVRCLDRQFSFWYGTPWSFHGTTQIPGEGSIACGYFVTTLLRDAGVPLNRVTLAQAPSEEMIQKLTAPAYIRRFSNISLTDFLKRIRQTGPGLYVVGLDNHTGFLLCQQNQVWFIHASGMLPFSVVREKAEDSGVLGRSNYRVVGQLSSDPAFLKKWLLNSSY